MSAVDEEMLRANQYKRPHYSDGDVVRIVAASPYQGQQAIVRGRQAWQTRTGYVVTYMYKLELRNGAYLNVYEEHIAPLA